MNLLNVLIDFLKKEASFPEKNVPEGLCPNCWGRQEYGGKFYEAVRNYKTDINSTDPKVGWIQEYANKHLLNIQLQKKNDYLVCQNCKLTYHPSKE